MVPGVSVSICGNFVGAAPCGRPKQGKPFNKNEKKTTDRSELNSMNIPINFSLSHGDTNPGSGSTSFLPDSPSRSQGDANAGEHCI